MQAAGRPPSAHVGTATSCKDTHRRDPLGGPRRGGPASVVTCGILYVVAQMQHYVPQFLLRRFALEGRRKHRSSYQLWVRDLKEGRTFPASVSDVAAETGFYQPRAGGPDKDWLEERLSQIESYAAQAVGRLAGSFNWSGHTEDDRITLAIFLITLYTRGPRVRRSLAEMPSQVLEHFRLLGETLAPELQKQLEEAAASDPVPAHSGVILETARMFRSLVERSWLLLVPPVGSRFMCGDCPVLMENPVPAPHQGMSNMGLMCPGVMLYLPLTPNLMLAVVDSVHGLPDRQVRHIGAEKFRAIQWLTGFHTERFVYGRASEDLMIPDGAWVGGRRSEIVSPALPREVVAP